MSRRISLTTKVLLFVSVPLLVQLGLLTALAYLQKQAEDALAASVHSKAISEKIHEITSDIYEFAKRYKSLEALENTPLDDDVGHMLTKNVWQDYNDLKELTKNQPEILSTVIASERTTREALNIYKEIKDNWNSPTPMTMREKILYARKMRAGRMDKILYQLFGVAEEQKKLFDKAPEEQAVFRKKAQGLTVALGVFDLALGIFLALFLTKGITERLRRVSENTTSLAAGLPLHPVINGTDEIAQLDQVFHKMAEELKESARKERAVIDNALDFICTIDVNNRMIAANPASSTLLGVQANDLIGKYAIDLFADFDKKRASEFFDKLKKEEITVPAELAMRSASGDTIETAWSAHWSEAESSLFCVVHDITERRRIEKLKQEVTAMITHDLRSPLNTVVNVFNLLEELLKESDEERVPRYITMGRRNTDRMLTLINDLLDIEKIKSGHMNIEIKDFYIADCFTACVELSLAAAEEAGVKLDFADSEISVSADQNLIDRVLTNFKRNPLLS